MKTTISAPVRPEADLETPPLPERRAGGGWLICVTLGMLAIAAAVLYYRIPVVR